MVQKKYNSFEEIDKDLKILRLKKEIAIWSAKNDYQRLQNNLNPKNMTLNALSIFTNNPQGFSCGKALRNILIAYLVKRIFKR